MKFLFISLTSCIFFFLLKKVHAGPPLQLETLNNNVLPFGDEDLDLQNQMASAVRLPSNVIPIHYDIELRPIVNQSEADPEQFTAPGKVSIRLKCYSASSNITLHSNQIEIQHDNVTVTRVSNGEIISVNGYSNDSTVSTYTINLSSELVLDEEYTLTISFIALVGNRLSGLYRSSYIDASGNRKWLATTQFQKLGARMAFPCFDEPALKATFNITIGRASGYNSLCNAPLVDSVPIPGLSGWFWDTHATTVRMSTYLIAIIVSDFVSIEAPTELSNYTVKVWGPPTMTTPQSAEFSSSAAARIVSYFETYYDSEFQFPKLDSVAVPDFSAGAMENWALNTYRLAYLLWYEGESTQFEKWNQASVIAHEISHHWFGDLVTCNWWNDLWLNEGFATYMQYLGANASGKDFGALDRYVIEVVQAALEFDAGPLSEPVHSTVTDIVVYQQTRILYQKGGALIRMMQSFLTEETLIAGLRNYLKTHEYSSTVQDDLFAELQAQAEADGTLIGLNVKDIMDSWTLQASFPLIRLSRAGPNEIFVSQERFSLPEQRYSQQNETTLWFVPISYATKSNPDFSSANWQPKFWIDNNTLVTSWTVENSTDEWILANPDARHYYRVIYDNNFLSLITTQLSEDHTVFSPSSRSQLIDDYFKSTFAKYVNIQQALELTLFLEKEDENIVWTTAFNNIRQPFKLFQDNNASVPLLKDYLLRLVTGSLNKIGWQQEISDAPVTIILRSQLLDWACSLESLECKEYANTLVSEWLTDPISNLIPADVQPIAFCTGITVADTTNVDIRQRLLDEYTKATRAERQRLFINALACETNQTAVESLLNQTIADPSNIDKNLYGVVLLQKIAENPDHRGTVLKFLEAEREAIIASLGESALSSVISTIASYTTDITVVGQVTTIIDNLIAGGVSDIVRDSLVSSRAQLAKNAQWITDYYDDIRAWLQLQTQ